MEFIKLKKHIMNITSEYEELFREKIENQEKEQAAVIKIQKCYRGYKGRKLYLIYKHFIKFAKNQMQLLSCVYLLKILRKQKMEKQMHVYFCDNALKIQKFYRGFYSRKYIHNFYERKRNILEIDLHMKEQQKKMLLEVEERRKKQLIYDNKLKEEKIEKVTRNLHHLVSTKAQKGIYNPKIENIIKEQKKKNPLQKEKNKEKMLDKKNFKKK